MPARIVLIGAPGAGKSTVGAGLADLWGCLHIDTDAQVSAQAGMSVADIFTTRGEAAFRALESQACLQAFAAEDAVVSVGGGAVLSEDVSRALAGMVVVWLQASAAQIAARVTLDVPRPLLLGNVRRQLLDLLAARTPVYKSLATITVQTDGKTPAQIVAEIVAASEGRG